MRYILVATLLFACTGKDPSPTDTDADTDTDTDSDTEVQAVSDLGSFCPMGCNWETCVDTESEDCESSLCLYDGRYRIDSYCTQPCEGECPEGYTCLTPEDGTGDVCMANEAVCGNGIKERGEACDDGNTEDGDYCAGDCSEETVPPSGGSFSFGAPGGTPIEFEGDEPTVYAYRIPQDDGTVDLSVGIGRNDIFDLTMSDVGNADLPGPVFTNVFVLFSVCNFAGAGEVTFLESYDEGTSTAKGTFSTEISCYANCFDCGGITVRGYDESRCLVEEADD